MNKSFESWKAREKGQAMEEWVAEYCLQRELQIIERNFRCPLGEIDLILLQEQSLVFVEVRFRKNTLYGGPLASIHWKKQQKLVRSAEIYLKMRPDFRKYACRFDVVGITIDNGLPKMEWIQNAFQAF